jgi:hypothetical protein
MFVEDVKIQRVAFSKDILSYSFGRWWRREPELRIGYLHGIVLRPEVWSETFLSISNRFKVPALVLSLNVLTVAQTVDHSIRQECMATTLG